MFSYYFFFNIGFQCVSLGVWVFFFFWSSRIHCLFEMLVLWGLKIASSQVYFIWGAKFNYVYPQKKTCPVGVWGIWFFGQNDGWTSVSVVIWYWKELATRLQLQNVFTKVVLLSIGFPLQSICAGCIQCHRCSSVPDPTLIWSVGRS